MKSKEQLRLSMPGKRFGPPPLKGPQSQLPPIDKNLSSLDLNIPQINIKGLKRGKIVRTKKR